MTAAITVPWAVEPEDRKLPVAQVKPEPAKVSAAPAEPEVPLVPEPDGDTDAIDDGALLTPPDVPDEAGALVMAEEALDEPALDEPALAGALLEEELLSEELLDELLLDELEPVEPLLELQAARVRAAARMAAPPTTIFDVRRRS